MNFDSLKKALVSVKRALLDSRASRVVGGLSFMYLGLGGLGFIKGFLAYERGMFSGGIFSTIFCSIFVLVGIGFIFVPPQPPRKIDKFPASEQ